MSTSNPFQMWMDALRNPKISEIGEASSQIMGAWTNAWQAALVGRAVPAMELLNPATWGKDGQKIADALESVLGTEFCKVYAAVKWSEQDEYLQVISPWEREHLLTNV